MSSVIRFYSLDLYIHLSYLVQTHHFLSSTTTSFCWFFFVTPSRELVMIMLTILLQYALNKWCTIFKILLFFFSKFHLKSHRDHPRGRRGRSYLPKLSHFSLFLCPPSKKRGYIVLLSVGSPNGFRWLS